MTAITTIRLNEWERAETSSYSDQIGPNEIKMPINPVLIVVARSRETLKYAHANAGRALLCRPGFKTAKHREHIYIMITVMMVVWIMMMMTMMQTSVRIWAVFTVDFE